MFKALFKIIINLLGSLVQIVCFPLNAIITNALPDLATGINKVTSVFGSVFSSLSWAMGLIPQPIIEVLLLIITIEIAKHTIYVSTHMLVKVWNLFQKIKFW